MSGAGERDRGEAPSLLPYHGDWASIHFGERRGERHKTTCYPQDVANTRTYTFNSLGFRGEEFDPHAYRTVFACGGSTTVGVGVTDEDVWTEPFKVRYAAIEGCGPRDVNVLNFGQGAAGSDYTVRTLLGQCGRFRPHLVIVHLTGSNARTEWFDAEDHLSLGPWMVDPENASEIPEVAAAFYAYYTPQLGALNVLKNILLLQHYCRNEGIPVLIAWSDYSATLEIAQNHPVCGAFVPLLDRRSLFEPRDSVDYVEEADHPGRLTHRLFATQLADMCLLDGISLDTVLCRTEALELDPREGTALLPIDRRFTLGRDVLAFVQTVDGETPVRGLVERCFASRPVSRRATDALFESLKSLVRFGILHFQASASHSTPRGALSTGISGLGMFYSPPVERDGVLHRGVVSAEIPRSLAARIDTSRWVIMHAQHAARPPLIDPIVNLYQCDPFFDNSLDGRPRVHAICRDFVDESVYRPLGVEKAYDVVFNACWSEVKRPALFADALVFAALSGRPISCVWYGYHWRLPSGAGTDQALEDRIRRKVEGLPVTFLATEWDSEENNRRFNSARVAVLTSTAEGGPRVMSEAMLAGLPYLAAEDVYGGSASYLCEANRNGALFEPTPRGTAECIWRTLDTLDEFRPREWALANMCRTVAVARLQDALRKLEQQTGWHINWQDVDHDGSAWTEWWKPVLNLRPGSMQLAGPQ